MTVDLHLGDCLEVLRTLPDCSVDAVVTDPPYGLAFMGKRWDHGVPGVEFWVEALRVAKPGAHLLAFGGTRTYHRLACAIEDAGWEIRDCVMWVYGSGFPKSHDVSKAIDKANGREFEHRYALGRHIRERREACGLSVSDVNSWFGYRDGCQHWERQDRHGARVPTAADWKILKCRLGLSPEWEQMIARIEAEREVVGQQRGSLLAVAPGQDNDRSVTTLDVTAPATDAARQWSGWGTALKPAWEPIIVARKPLCGTVAENVLKHGTGGINVDGCRVGVAADDLAQMQGRSGASTASKVWGAGIGNPNGWEPTASGRWPANVIHDGSDEVVGLFPETTSGSRKAGRHIVAGGQGRYGLFAEGELPEIVGDSGSAARFFYCAKASKADRDADNKHPTVKPTALMRYLCRLVTPPGGVVLDPFTGSGSTGKAAILEGFRFIGIEREAEYVEIARARIGAVEAGAAPLFNKMA